MDLAAFLVAAIGNNEKKHAAQRLPWKSAL
jgi:hypothetical protein